MSKKVELQKAIEASTAEIDELESKRNRSQAALILALIDHKAPDPKDVEYFKVYNQLIELERKNLHKLTLELKQLENKH